MHEKKEVITLLPFKVNSVHILYGFHMAATIIKPFFFSLAADT